MISARTAITIIVLLTFAGVAAAVLLYAGVAASPFESSMQVLSIVAPFVTLVLGFWFGTSQADAAQQQVDQTRTDAARLVAELQSATDPAVALQTLQSEGVLRRLT